MPRNGRRNPARNQERILRAATEEFARYGLGGARVDRIAARANANKRMLYNYYGNKEDLLLAVMEDSYAHIRRAELGLHLQDLDPVQGVRRLHDMLRSDTRVSATTIQTVGSKGYDGFTLALVN